MKEVAMGMFLLWLMLGLGAQLWLCVRVARSSLPWALITFLLGPLGALTTVYKHRGARKRPQADALRRPPPEGVQQSGKATFAGETSVTVPFVASLICCVGLGVVGWRQALSLANPPAGAVLQATGPAAPVRAAGFTPASLTLAPPVLPQVPGVPPDTMDLLAAELRSMGVQATVLRLPATTRLPDGVVAGAQLALSGRRMPVWGGASTPDRETHAGLSGLFLRCDAASTCRGVARSYMAQDPATRPRVLQNGAMLLLISSVGSADTGDMHNVVASAFRHLPP
jgi:hypothetical protein